jgi:predicted Rossmann-fold nucleotide-binding protein
MSNPISSAIGIVSPDVARRLTKDRLVMGIATAIGFMGGFPTPAPQLTRFAHKLGFQYALLFVLIFQGGGGGDVGVSLALTGIMAALNEGLKAIHQRKTGVVTPA